MLNVLVVYSLLVCTSVNNNIALLPEAQKKHVFVTTFRKFESKKLPFGLAQAPLHFQNKLLKGLPFDFRYLDDILLFIENNAKYPEYSRPVLGRI